MTSKRLYLTAGTAAFAAAGLMWMNSFASLQWPSVLVYSGLVVVAAGVLSVFLPPRWLGVSSRFYGLFAGLAIGAALFLAGWSWPARTLTAASPGSGIDEFMPTFSFHERHEITIRAPAERVRETLNRISFEDIAVVKTLGAIRGAAMRTSAPSRAQGVSPAMPFVEMVNHPRSGFFLLKDTPREFVFGLAGQPWNNRGVRLQPEQFLTWAPPDNVKIAGNFLIEDLGEGRSRVVTETRVAASDESSRRKMARYWALIYPGSGMIRRSLLNAIREHAERS